MSTALMSEAKLSLAEAAKLRDVWGRVLAIQTLHRYRLRGTRGGIKLETCLIGGLRYTSREACLRMIEAQNSGDSKPAKSSPEARAKRSAAARRELQEAGVC